MGKSIGYLTLQSGTPKWEVDVIAIVIGKEPNMVKPLYYRTLPSQFINGYNF